MNYEHYKNARNLVWQILLQEGENSLPINVSQLCRKLQIQVKLYEPEDDNSGECRIIGGTPVILVSRFDMPSRQRFTAAHELGHILLGHVGKHKLVKREPSSLDNPIEQEANVFASRLLAPACVLWGCNVKTAEDIIKLCDISRQAAEYRMERMNELYKRDMFLSHPLEREVYRQFYEYIREHRL